MTDVLSRPRLSRSARRSGVLVPLFSLTSTRSWGIGEFFDLPVFAEWLRAAGQSFVQILPITEIPDAETSPYSALTAMAIDPIYVVVPAVEDFQALGGESQFSDDDRATLEEIRKSTRIKHERVRHFKTRWLRRAYQHFVSSEATGTSARAQRCRAFMKAEAWWLDDYALFQALRVQHQLLAWWDWPQPLAHRDPAALARAREELRGEVSYRQYVQWIAAEQWSSARQKAQPTQVFGDVPFMISADSPDVWTRQEEFRFDATVGVPPDAFSETGQDWGLPPWRWEVMAATDYEWMRRRARRTAHLFDGFRLDHLVGLYRTYHRPRDPAVRPFFAPADEPAQLALGERLVTIYLDSGAEVVAEDLGTVPDFVRQSLQRLGVPGFKVFRWERQWSARGQPFIDPGEYPQISVATSSTHDNEPLAEWWDTLSPDERAQVLETKIVKRLLSDSGVSVDATTLEASPPELIDALVRAVLGAASQLVIIPIQDVFGWRDRINTPAVVDDENWTWRMPWPVDRLHEIPEARARAELLAKWTRSAGR